MLTKSEDPRISARRLPSVDRVLHDPALATAIESFGRPAVVDAVRAVLAELRCADSALALPAIFERCRQHLEQEMLPSLRRVINLTGTVLHTNLGRALLPETAARAAAAAMAENTNLEFDLEKGGRGERDDHVRRWLRRLTGAESATVVNNNAAAVLLVLNSLALGREVPVSRGELIEIGGAFRMPEIMKRAGCKLVEVGTTNRTHLSDYVGAVGPRTALFMQVHPSNYAISGFTATVGHAELAAAAQRHGLPLVADLGSGTLVDLARYGLPHEPTPREVLAAGADLVTFSGDKLLGGPQAGIIVGRAEYVRKLERNPLRRALRMDKGRLAALEAVLRLYADPDRLAERLPTLRFLTRDEAAIEAQGQRLLPPLARVIGDCFEAELQPCRSQIGSGALPVDRLPSHCIALRPRGKPSGTALNRLAAALRALPVPVIGRLEDGWLKLDLRCLDDESTFVQQLDRLALPEPHA